MLVQGGRIRRSGDGSLLAGSMGGASATGGSYGSKSPKNGGLGCSPQKLSSFPL